MSLHRILAARELHFCSAEYQKDIQQAIEDRFIVGSSERFDYELPPTVSSTIAIAWSFDGYTFASTHGDHTVKIFVFSTGKQIANLKGHPRTPWTVKYHPIDANIVASGCLGFEVRVWDIARNACISKTTLQASIISLAFHPQGEFLAVANGNILQLWEWRTNNQHGHAVVRPSRPGGDRDSSISSNNCSNSSSCSSSGGNSGHTGHLDMHCPVSDSSVFFGVSSCTVTHSRNIRAILFHPTGHFVFIAAPDKPRDPAATPSTHSRLYVVSFASLFQPSARDFELSTLPTLLPQIHLYSDGGIDISRDGRLLLTSAVLTTCNSLNTSVQSRWRSSINRIFEEMEGVTSGVNALSLSKSISDAATGLNADNEFMSPPRPGGGAAASMGSLNRGSAFKVNSTSSNCSNSSSCGRCNPLSFLYPPLEEAAAEVGTLTMDESARPLPLPPTSAPSPAPLPYSVGLGQSRSSSSSGGSAGDARGDASPRNSRKRAQPFGSPVCGKAAPPPAPVSPVGSGAGGSSVPFGQYSNSFLRPTIVMTPSPTKCRESSAGVAETRGCAAADEEEAETVAGVPPNDDSPGEVDAYYGPSLQEILSDTSLVNTVHISRPHSDRRLQNSARLTTGCSGYLAAPALTSYICHTRGFLPAQQAISGIASPSVQSHKCAERQLTREPYIVMDPAEEARAPAGFTEENHLCLFKIHFQPNNLAAGIDPPELLNSKFLPGKLMKTITSTKLSATQRYGLVGYGVRVNGRVEEHSCPTVACEIVGLLNDAAQTAEAEARAERNLMLYNATTTTSPTSRGSGSDNGAGNDRVENANLFPANCRFYTPDLPTVGLVTDLEDEINIAHFHPVAGQGVIYGTKRGLLRSFHKDC